MSKDTLYVVQFVGKPRSDDEIIQKSSERLAKHGTYTKRADIPRWDVIKRDDELVPIVKNSILSVYPLLTAQQKGESCENILDQKLLIGQDCDMKPQAEILEGGIEVPPTIAQDQASETD